MSEQKEQAAAPLEIMRHSTAHLMAAAVQKLYPEAKFGIGPTVENGFYYDIDLPEQLSPDDLLKIEKQMKKMLSANLSFEREEMSIDEAIKLFKSLNQDYKVELLNDIKAKGTTKMAEDADAEVLDGQVSVYKTGKFVDLCRGPHVQSSKDIKAFKLSKLAGAYWRGNSDNKMLQRIYGYAFMNQAELDDYLHFLVEAEKRDHRKIGKEQDLFSFHDQGPGFPFWHARGMILYRELEEFIRQENNKRGYDEIKTPIILNKDLWLTSGHWEKFREDMYFTDIDESEYAVKPMNCPGGLLIYKDHPHSYRELPIRNAELGLVHRHELSGVLHGLFRVRAFTQDDAHCFCMPEQLQQEIINMVEFALDVYSAFDFNEYTIYIATRPEKYIGSDEDWDKATQALKDALSAKGMAYQIKEGEGAFYGPKIEFNIKDSLGRDWQCGTIQVDYSMPGRFGATYIDTQGQEQTPIMVHRAILGSLERFIGIFIEHYAGSFPVWLSPVQVLLIPVGGDHKEYCQVLDAKFSQQGLRAEVDNADETVGNKIRKAVKQKTPYILVIGDKEMNSHDLQVRLRGQEELLQISEADFVARIQQEIAQRKDRPSQ